MPANNVTLEKVPYRPPDATAASKVYRYFDGEIEIQSMEQVSKTLNNYRKCSGGLYVNTQTGEAIEARPSSVRSENPDSIRRSLKRLQKMIRCNFSGRYSELHLLLTFSPPEFDFKKASHEGSKFISRLRYAVANLEFIKIMEPHQNGSWHFHVLVKMNNGKRLEIPSEQLSRIWKHGFVKAKRLAPSVHHGIYFTKRAKRELFRYYPAHCRVFNCSRGIQQPKPLHMPYGDTRKLVENYALVYASTIDIIHDHGNGVKQKVNAITYEQFHPD
jgi:hypothetical protein